MLCCLPVARLSAGRRQFLLLHAIVASSAEAVGDTVSPTASASREGSQSCCVSWSSHEQFLVGCCGRSWRGADSCSVACPWRCPSVSWLTLPAAGVASRGLSPAIGPAAIQGSLIFGCLCQKRVVFIVMHLGVFAGCRFGCDGQREPTPSLPHVLSCGSSELSPKAPELKC